MFAGFEWVRDQANPILPPLVDSVSESARCMNPFVLEIEDEYRLYYSGGDEQGKQRICWATAARDTPTKYARRGVVFDVGDAGAFDAHWCVLPYVHRFGERWHLYYTGHEGTNLGLQSFSGIGLATSEDGVHFARHAREPIITGDRIDAFPHNRGIAGGGSIVEEVRTNSHVQYRLYYTLAVGTPSEDVRVDQEKHCAVCHSTDGIEWTDHRLILSPRAEVANEDIAVAAPFVWRDGDLYRMLYCGIGTRWGYYSISEAYSADGYLWERGTGDENLSLLPDANSPWESQMVEYPCVIREGDTLRLFYCGNGYGKTGIGTATACLPSST